MEQIMQEEFFVARTDVEMGDAVGLAHQPNSSEVFYIWDIRTVHSLRSGTTHFEFQMARDAEGKWLTPWMTRDRILYPHPKEGAVNDTTIR